MGKAQWAIMKRRMAFGEITFAGRIKAESRACVPERNQKQMSLNMETKTSYIRMPD